jgi:riboflavin synthase
VFTGIVRELGSVVEADEAGGGRTLVVRAPETSARTRVGDSVSIDGCCLTATAIEGEAISFHAVPETTARTTLGSLAAGDAVNVEPALRAGEPLGGHYVQGHVDAVGTVRRLDADGDGTRVWVDAPPELLRYVVEKGSIAVDGVSLTVADIDGDTVTIALIPHTLAVTTLGRVAPGDPVNLEVDVIAKYVARLTERSPA